MNTNEYAKLDQLDRQHWFYTGKRATVKHWINRNVALKPDDLLIDAGCGTGTFLTEMSSSCKVLGLDDHDESIALAKPRLEAVGGKILQTKLDKVDLPDGCASVITAQDVLEHLDDDGAAVRELTRLLKPGGVLVVTVPALRMLWSDWDVSLHHRRRYHQPELKKLLSLPTLDLVRCSYFNSILLPAIMMVRTWRKFFPPKPGDERAEDRVPGSFVNRILYHTMVKPACWGWFEPPAGVSLLAVARKR